MRVCVLTSSYEGSESEMSGHDPAPDAAPHLAGHVVEHVALRKATAVRQVRELADRGFDVFVNLCDGAWEEDRAGIEVVQALERLGQAFTGAGSEFYEPTRESMKRACWYAGVPTPAHFFTDTPDASAVSLRFPMIVKHPNGYSSVGMTRDSVVSDAAGLQRELERIIGAYGAALVEEYIDGREFTVLVAEGGVSYTPVEVSFPPGESFKHFDLKWVDYEDLGWEPVADAALDRRLRELGLAMFDALGGSGYGRVDVRMDAAGELYALEINPNCAVFYPAGQEGSADVILGLDPGGGAAFAETIMASALARRDRQVQRWEINLVPGHGYAMRAAADLAEGDLIQAYEEAPHVLVSRTHVDANWDEQYRRWFAQYAYPITDEVFVMWGERPDDWRPLNHSCDPSAWLRGLDLVARQAIPRGAPITMDYATFLGEDMEDFECFCGTASCRGTIRGTDHLLPFVGERYGDHVSDYVRRRRAAAGRHAAPGDR